MSTKLKILSKKLVKIKGVKTNVNKCQKFMNFGNFYLPTSGMRIVGLAGSLLDGIEDCGVSLGRNEAFNIRVVGQEGVEGLEAGSGGQITKRHF